MKNPKKVVLAYSGGLDTSVIAKWLMDKYECEVITFTADIGQGNETKEQHMKISCPARSGRLKTGQVTICPHE